MATNPVSQSVIDQFNNQLAVIVRSNNNSNPDSNETVSNPSPLSIGQAIDTSQITPAQYSSFSGVDPTTAQQMYETANPEGRYSNQTIPGTQTTWSSLASIPGLYDYIKTGSNQTDADGNSLPDSQTPAQALAKAMQDPKSFVKDYLQNQIENIVVGTGFGSLTSVAKDELTANYQNAIAYLGQNGVPVNDIQTLTNNAIGDGNNKVAYYNANNNGGFVNNLVQSIASPQGIASIVANTVLPGSGAFIPLASAVLSGKQNLTQPLENLAISGVINGTDFGSNINNSIASNITSLTGIPSSIAKNIATGTLSTVGGLASGQNIDNSVAQGVTSGLSSAITPSNNSSSGSTTTTAPLSSTSPIASTLESATAPTNTSGALTQINAGSGSSNTLPISSSTGAIDLTNPNVNVSQIANNVASGSGTTQPTINDTLQEINPTVASGNPALTTQILPSATDVIKTVNNFDGTSTVTYADGSTKNIETPNTSSATSSNPSSNGGLSITVPTSSGGSGTPTGSGKTGALPSTSSTGSTGSINPSSPLTSTLLSTGEVLSKSPLEQALNADQTSVAPTYLNQLIGQSSTYQPVSEGSSDIKGFKEGGSISHIPEFITGHSGHYAEGRGTGQSDDIPALLKDGDYVMDADVVSGFGDGSSKAGAEVLSKFMDGIDHKHYENYSSGGHINAMIADGEFVFPSSFVTAIGGGSNKKGAEKLDKMREAIREHKRSASTNTIPAKAKSPLSYLKGKK